MKQIAYVVVAVFLLLSAVLFFNTLFFTQQAELRDLFDLKIFMEAPDWVCLERRLDRDVHERGRTPESIREQYAKTVRPGARQYILPCAEWADLVMSGTAPVAESGARVLEMWAARK